MELVSGDREGPHLSIADLDPDRVEAGVECGGHGQAGAALTLGEFALWLRLDDVYWGPEGRRSVDAVLIASVIGALLLVEFSPFDDDANDNRVVASVVLVVDMLFVLAAILNGRTLLGVLGVFVPLLALVAACRLARPRSPWACRFYRLGSGRLARARRRFPDGRRSRWDPLVDLFAGPTAAPGPGTTGSQGD